jgi:hypothetical protein
VLAEGNGNALHHVAQFLDLKLMPFVAALIIDFPELGATVILPCLKDTFGEFRLHLI